MRSRSSTWARSSSLPGFDDRKRCEQIVGRINRKQALGRYAKGTTNGYYVALPYPVVLEAPIVPAHDLDDIDPFPSSGEADGSTTK